MKETINDLRSKFELGRNEGLSVYIVHPKLGNRETVTAIVDNDLNLSIKSSIASPSSSVYGERHTDITAKGMNVFGTTTHEGREIIFSREETDSL